MAFVKDLFSSNKGAGFQAQSASISNPVTPEQINAAYQQSQQGLTNQDAFVQALTQAANPALGNQSSLNALLMNQSMGGGPNPAADQFRQNTGQIAAQQAGAISSQKGISPALASRMIAMQGGAAQQNAAATAAQMRANQILNSQQLLNQNSAQQVGQAMQGQQAYNQSAQGEQQNLFGALGQYNSSAVGATNGMNSANATIASQNAQNQAKMFNSFAQAGGKAVGMPGMAQGGEVPAYNAGGPVSGFGKHMANYKSGGMVSGKAPMSGDSRANDVVPAMLSPKEIVLPRSVTMDKDAPKKAAEFVAAIMARKKS